MVQIHGLSCVLGDQGMLLQNILNWFQNTFTVVD